MDNADSAYNGQLHQQHAGAPLTPSTSVEYDGHVNQITIPSYASTPATSPQTPFSPRAMAIQQLKRAASVREAAAGQQQQHLTVSNSDNGHHNQQPVSTPSSSGHSHHSPDNSPSIGMSPSMSRAPSIKRLGLERSASDAARRLAMAKLTGEKVSAPLEYTMPKTPLPTGPLPSLADLQARHEQRHGLTSPEPVPSTSSSGSPSHALSRNPSSASASLSRQLSAASTRTGPNDLSRNPSLARSLAAGAQSPAPSSSGEQTNMEGAEDDESRQRRTDERQEARSNLIRKLSRGRLAGAAAAANIRDRNAAQAQAASGTEGNPPSNPASPGLQRRPSLAEMLARAESRNQGRSQTPETPSRSAAGKEQQDSPSQSQLPTPSSASRMNEIISPASTSSIPTSASSLRKAAALHQYDHIPIPPTPATASTVTSHSNSASNSHFSPSNSTGGGPASGHESISSAVSNYRSYRHTMERDRDSALARMEMEDAFEFDIAALEAARASVATNATSAPAPSSSSSAFRGASMGAARTRLHEHHPSLDNEGAEELEDEDDLGSPGPGSRYMQEANSMSRQNGFSPSSALHQAHLAPKPSPPDSPLAQKRAPHTAQHEANDYLAARPKNSRQASNNTTSSSRSAGHRDAGSMPQTPGSNSPVSPFAFSPAPGSPVLASEQSLPPASTSSPPQESQLQDPPLSQEDPIEQSFSFLRHHQKEPNGDFPVSVISSRASQYPDFASLPSEEQPPLPPMAPLPVDLQSVMKNRNDSPHLHMPPPLPEKSSGWGEKGNLPLAQESQVSRSGAVQEGRMPYINMDEDDNAGPTSEYRFPTASSRGHRPDSISSSNGHHDDNLNSMISQLEAMQAAGGTDSASNSPVAVKAFNTRGVEQSKKILPRQVPQQTFPQAGPSYQPNLHQRHQDTPEGKPLSLTHLASQLRQPIAQANGSGSPRLAERPLHAPIGRSLSNARRPTPASATTRQPATGAVGHISRESAAEVLDFGNEGPAYHSGASAENDSAPSLARTGTGSSTSGFSTNSDHAFAVTSAVVPPNQTKEQVMTRLSSLLSAYKSQGKKPSALENPPRQLLLHSPVLQVVNSNTVKDRYLFLFTDILLIAKPLIDEDPNGEPLVPSLNTRFIVKSIVELPKLKLTAQTADTGEDPVQKRKHPLLLTFVDRFANDPRKAVSALVAKAGLSNDAATIANLLFRNPELNRSQLGAFLAHKDQKPVLKAYCDRFRLAGIRIEDALRVFIGSLRLPNDYTAAEYMLGVFASQWLANNPGTGMTNDGVFATKLVLSMMELNDALHSGIDDEATAAGNLFSFPNSAITVDDFITAFRLKDPHGALPDEHLTRIYLSIRKDRLQQAADNAVVSGTPEIEVIIHPGKLPNRLTYRTASENISLTIPKVDPKFAIKLVGQDLRFEPPVLTFARSRTATFRVTPTALGSKAMLFIRLGQNAHLYSNLPINKTFSVERAFMNHTFQIAFVNHLGVKRKYLFSLSSAEAKYNWVDTLRTKIENSPIEQAETPRPARLSDAVSLQVLRDALIAPDEPAPVLANKTPLFTGRPGFHTPPSSRGRSAAGAGLGLQRSNSFSKTYVHGQGKAESDLNDQRRPSGSTMSLLAPLSMRRGSRDDEKTVTQQQHQPHKTGEEIILAVRQNSLMPLVLGFVGAGVEGLDALPRKPVYPQSTQVHVTPPPVRGTGRFKNL